MAEGGDYDPTTEKTPLIPGTEDGADDDDVFDWEAPIDFGPDEPDRTQPFEPGAASTPAGGESIPMATRLPPEKQGISTTQDAMAKSELENIFPDMSRTELEFKYEKAPKSGGLVIKVKYHTSDTWYSLYTKSKGNEEKTFNTNLPQQISQALGKSAEEIIAEDNTALQDTQRRLDEAQQAEVRLNAQAQKQEQEAQERQRLETQLEQINQ